MAIITITGGIGCDVERIAEQVAAKLKLPLLDDQKLLEEAEKMGISSKEGMESLKEKPPGFIDRVLTNKPESYLDMMEGVIFKAARNGDGVILGHGSQMLLREFEGVLHVRIYASVENQSRDLANRQVMSAEAAAKLIHKSDSEKRGFMHNAFHTDWNDLVNIEESLEKKAIVKIIESTLLKAKISRNLSIETIKKDVIKITEFVDSSNLQNDIIKIVKNVPGVSKVISEIAVYPVGGGL